MPYVVVIRPAELVPLEVPEADSFAEIDAGLRAQVPDGHELVDIRVSQPRGANHMVGTGAARRLETKEIRIETREELWTEVPEGWQALSIRGL